MITAVDSSVILDVLAGNPRDADRSAQALEIANSAGQLIVCEAVVAEITPEVTDVAAFFDVWQIRFVPSTLKSAILAGEMYGRYRLRGGRKLRVVADFFVGAHAKLIADRLLARD